MLKNICRKGRLLNQYIRSRIRAPGYSSAFNDIETFCVFIGYPRSGHSLIGSLLDAHPDMVFSNELNVLRYIKYKFSRKQLFYLILENSRNFSAKGRVHTGYNYKVDNQWQGRYNKIKVIGDKRGGGSVKKLSYKPDLFETMHQEIDKPIKFIHVIRNPFDNISTMHKRSSYKTLNESLDFYFFLVDEVSKIRNNIPKGYLIDLRYEDFILAPKESLSQLTTFLGVNSDTPYLEACSKILFKKPKQTRQSVPWNDELIKQVNDRISKYPFLNGYSFYR